MDVVNTTPKEVATVTPNWEKSLALAKYIKMTRLRVII